MASTSPTTNSATPTRTRPTTCTTPTPGSTTRPPPYIVFGDITRRGDKLAVGRRRLRPPPARSASRATDRLRKPRAHQVTSDQPTQTQAYVVEQYLPRAAAAEAEASVSALRAASLTVEGEVHRPRHECPVAPHPRRRDSLAPERRLADARLPLDQQRLRRPGPNASQEHVDARELSIPADQCKHVLQRFPSPDVHSTYRRTAPTAPKFLLSKFTGLDISFERSARRRQ